jgi:hypothetical protein
MRLFKAHHIFSSAPSHASNLNTHYSLPLQSIYTFIFQRFHTQMYILTFVTQIEYCLYRNYLICGEKSVSMCWFFNDMCECTKHIQTSHLHKCQRQKKTRSTLIFFLSLSRRLIVHWYNNDERHCRQNGIIVATIFIQW